MAQISNQMIYNKLDTYIEKNEEAHDKITKMLLGNGEVGLLEQARDHDRLFLEHQEEISKHCNEIDFIKANYTKRKSDKWSLTKKLTVIGIVAGNIGAILAALNWINSVLAPLRAAIIP